MFEYIENGNVSLVRPTFFSFSPSPRAKESSRSRPPCSVPFIGPLRCSHRSSSPTMAGWTPYTPRPQPLKTPWRHCPLLFSPQCRRSTPLAIGANLELRWQLASPPQPIGQTDARKSLATPREHLIPQYPLSSSQLHFCPSVLNSAADVAPSKSVISGELLVPLSPPWRALGWGEPLWPPPIRSRWSERPLARCRPLPWPPHCR
jgi:hypothetical protein